MSQMGRDWTLADELYVDGITHDEAMDELVVGKFLEQEFEIL